MKFAGGSWCRRYFLTYFFSRSVIQKLQSRHGFECIGESSFSSFCSYVRTTKFSMESLRKMRSSAHRWSISSYIIPLSCLTEPAMFWQSCGAAMPGVKGGTLLQDEPLAASVVVNVVSYNSHLVTLFLIEM